MHRKEARLSALANKPKANNAQLKEVKAVLAKTKRPLHQMAAVVANAHGATELIVEGLVKSKKTSREVLL